MAWQQLSVITDEETAPKVAGYLERQNAVSVTYMDAEDEPVYEPAIGETKIWSNTQVVALFEMDVDVERVQWLVEKKFKKFPLHDWKIERVEDQAWERAWMDYYQPMKFADKLWVCPTGQEQQEEGTVCLILDPGLAFGTGTHPTTALCLEWLASHDLTGKTVIDYGCGSGILAVAAVLLGASVAYGVDIDPQAIIATNMNAEKNGVADKVRCYLPEAFERFEADIVLANILANPLIEMAEDITGLVKNGGALVLSGILAEQAPSVLDAYKMQGLHFNPVIQQEDWVRLDGQLLSVLPE